MGEFTMYRNANQRGLAQPAYREPYMDRAEAYYAGARSGPIRPMKQSQKQSHSTKIYKKEKEEKFRMEKGTKVLESYHQDLKKSLLCGFESMEEILKAKEYENTARSVALPVSTRAVGISIVNTVNKVSATEANRQRLPPKIKIDMWTSAANQGYLSLTTHFINENKLE